MARKSRKNIQKINFTTNQKTYSVGVYVRLSVLDNNKKDSDTLENQKNIILDYIKDKEEFNLFEIYEDNNFSGVNFNRNGFERLLEDVKQGKVNCIIVKDLSRFGRNYIECGNYLEKIFPFIDIRFIAINDGYDSNNENSSEILLMHLKNIVNEVYAKDISKKVRSAFKEKRKNGDFIGGRAGYGYLKDPNNKNKLIINKETAPIVKYIFDLRLKAYSYRKIAVKLNDKNILSPYAYLYKIGILKYEKFKTSKWTVSTVRKILYDQIYIGNMVKGKTRSNLSKNEKQKAVPENEWIIVPNTHKPIIDKEVFNKVNEINENAKNIYLENNKAKLIKNKTENIFKGLIKCGTCNKNLTRREKGRKNKKKGISIFRYFECRYYNNCNFKSINENLLKEVVFEEVKKQIKIAIKLENIINKNNKIITLEENSLNNLIENIEIEICKIKSFYKVIYEDYTTGLLDEENYLFTKNSYLEKEKELNKTKEGLINKLLNLKTNLSNENKYLKEFLKFKNSKILTKDLLTRLIKEIAVYEDKTIQITFNYIDEYNMLLNEMEKVLKYAI